ncbi:MAG: GxxExxY protein [Phycisphaerae bacterium]|nr:GxxExxY protein [Phycisphaerae bacterium]
MTDDGNSVEVRRDVDDPLTYGLIGAAQKVHRTLGPGFKESTYHNALSKELMIKGIAFASQPKCEVFYEDMLCGVYQPDLVVVDTVLLELKAVSAIAPEHKAQTIGYLKASGLKVALLINFGARSLEYRRFQN